jgi:hypothetical protein
MTAELAASCQPLALLEALAGLVASDGASLATARTLADCDRDDAIARQLGALLVTLRADPRAAGRRELLDAARTWHEALVERLARRRRFVLDAHEMAGEGLTTPERLFDNSLCRYIAEEISEEEHARGREAARITREVFGGDVLAEMRAWRDGTHPLKQPKQDQSAV